MTRRQGALSSARPVDKGGRYHCHLCNFSIKKKAAAKSDQEKYKMRVHYMKEHPNSGFGAQQHRKGAAHGLNIR